MIRILTILLAVLLAGPGSAGAQAEATNPHGPLDLDCRLCHTDQSWEVADAPPSFDHDSTGYPLEGRHEEAACRDCHEEIVFSHVGTSCADCHEDFHRGRLGFDCQECHTPRRWVDPSANRTRHDATSFPLVGIHARVDCDACHADLGFPEYVGTPTSCVSCHRNDFEATEDPAHGPAGFGEDCESCHSVMARSWGGGDFLHPASFPLTEGHGGLECAACHDNGFVAVPTDCYACHQIQYENASDPDHTAAGFPTTCASCHGTLAWEPADWDHDILFPIYTGRHREEWNTCADCHQVSQNYGLFECIYCHEHNPTDTDNDHDEVGDYVYLSTACFRCHPRGEEED